jgi:three-Cys-motif partner protein
LNHSYFAQLGRCEFVFLFVDEKADRIEYLETVALPKLGPLPPNVKVNTSTEKFDVVMTGILDHLAGRGARMAPAFAFVDPFGFGGVSMDLIARILEHDRSEVFITLTLDAINRFLTHRDPSINAHYDALFGDPAWRDAADAADRIEAVENMYAVQLGKHANCVWSFRMPTDRGRPVYDLFFGTKHIEGLKKMKKAMWKADPVAGVRFSDRRATEIRLFEETLDTTPLQEALSKQFAGRTVSYNELWSGADRQEGRSMTDPPDVDLPMQPVG